MEPATETVVGTSRETKRYFLPIFVVGLITFLAFVTGYLIGSFPRNNNVQKDLSFSPPTLPEQQIMPTAVLTPDSNPTQSPEDIYSLFEKPDDVVLDICGGNWEGTEQHPYETECLKFYSSGDIHKTIDNKVISTNENSSESDRQKIAQDVSAIYSELQTEPFRKWLLQLKAPVTGGTMRSITTYAKAKSVKQVSQQSLVTVYIWGADYSKESQRLIEIFDTLKSYTSSVNKIVDDKTI